MKEKGASFVVAVNWKDRWHLPACVSSIRRYYPDAAITLLKDTFRGPVPTSRLENRFGVSVHPTRRAYGGGGWIKLLPAILGEESRSFNYPLMVLDADTLLMGPVFDELMNMEGCIVVSPDVLARPAEKEYISKTYIATERLAELGVSSQRADSFPWFNSGQLLLREPFIDPRFISAWLDWDAAPVARRDRSLHPLTDQSILNHYLLVNDQVRMGLLDFMDWAGDMAAWEEARRRNSFKASTARVLHYAGVSRIPFWKMVNWRPFQKENRAAERVLGNVGSLFLTHAIQHYLRGIFRSIGSGRRDALKRALASRKQ